MLRVTSLVMVTEALALLLVSAWLVAVTVTLAGLGRSRGAVYNPEGEIVPSVLLPPGVPLTLHVTPVLEVPVMVAVNCWLLPSRTLAEVGDNATVTISVELAWPPPPQLETIVTTALKAKRKAAVRSKCSSHVLMLHSLILNFHFRVRAHGGLHPTAGEPCGGWQQRLIRDF
jgi:hypothetical protein